MAHDDNTYLSPSLERLLLYLSFGIISLIGFEALAVATAMPTVVGDLDGRTMYALAMGAPLATQMMTVALAGPWSDSIGPRSCLFTGILLFSVGLAVATAAPTMPVFVGGRAIQGLGGGLSIVPLYTIIGSSVKPSHQTKFFSTFAAAWILPALIGPAISGLVVERWSWRWIFGAVPFLLLVASPLIVRVMAQISGESKPLDRAGLRRSLIPAIVAGVALATLQVLSGRSEAEFTPAVYATMGVSILVALAAIRPLVPAGTLTSRRGLASTVLLRGALNGSFLGTEAYLPLLLKEVHGWSAFEAGMILLVGSLVWAIGSALPNRLVNPAHDRMLPLGSAIMLAGLVVALPSAFASLSPAFLIVGWGVAAFGCGLAYPGLSVHALALTPMKDKGKTSSALQLAETFGAGFSIAITGVVFALLQPDPSLPFAGAMGTMVLLQAGALLSATRIRPVPGSTEARQLERTYSLDHEESDTND